jgi:hypothetical protein
MHRRLGVHGDASKERHRSDQAQYQANKPRHSSALPAKRHLGTFAGRRNTRSVWLGRAQDVAGCAVALLILAIMVVVL